jgi:biopolymer transport protein ExbD
MIGVLIASPDQEEKKINFLLAEIEKSNSRFIRNGKAYSSKEAANHLKQKYLRAKNGVLFVGGDKNITVEKFIEKIASHSETSKTAYLILLPNKKKPVILNGWLYQKLKEFK